MLSVCFGEDARCIIAVRSAIVEEEAHSLAFEQRRTSGADLYEVHDQIEQGSDVFA